MMYGFGIGFSPSNRLFSGSGGAVNPLWNGLQAYYTADNTPNDALGNYNGTLVNGATYGTGVINEGFSLDGVNDSVNGGTYIYGDNTQPYTFSAWINASSFSTNNWVIGAGDASNGLSMAIRNSKLTIWKGIAAISQSTTVLSINTLYHICIVYKGSGSNNVDFYVDGSLTNSGTLGGSWSSSSTDLIIGSSVSGLYFSGIIDETAIWERALLSTEVTQLYNSGVGLQYPN